MAFLWRMLLGLAACSGAQALPTLSLSPSTAVVAPGGGFSLDLMASGVDQGIGAWSLALVVADPGVASLTGISFSAALGAIGSEALAFGDPLVAGAGPTAGSQRFDVGLASLLSAADLVGLQGTSFRLATLSFAALAGGTAHFALVATLDGAVLGDAAGNAVAPGLYLGASVSVVAAPLPPLSPVPEPSTAALVAAGLAGLAIARRGGHVRPPG